MPRPVQLAFTGPKRDGDKKMIYGYTEHEANPGGLARGPGLEGKKMDGRQSVAGVRGISLVQNFDLQGYGADYSGSPVSGAWVGRGVGGWRPVIMEWR